MLTNLKTLIEETRNDLEMLERIGLKSTPHWNSVTVALRRLKDFEAELFAIHFSLSDENTIRVVEEILGEK